MNIFNQQLILVALVLNAIFSPAVLAFEDTSEQSKVANTEQARGEFSGNLRIGYISADDDSSDRAHSSAIGGELSYSSVAWQGISATGTLYTTQKLFNDDNSSFFSSNGDSYAILAQAYLQANITDTEIKVGRFGFDSPHADMDDIRMVANTFSGILVTNTSITDSRIYLAHLDKWSGVDSDQPEDFTNLNGSDGVNIFGVVYQGFENVALQSWYYHAKGLADLFYVAAETEFEHVTLGVQYAKQADNSNDHSGPDGHVYGITASYTVSDFTFSSAYNYVSGAITNGFGSGPFFTSAANYTIGGVIDQNALAIGVDYTGIDKLTIGLLNVAFAQGEDEFDVFVSYDFGHDMAFDFIYHHLHQDGDMVLAIFNLGF
tara:strand:- start:10520 stop:11644 length:1125 start_codon:yes stop_codon:yes gene_type:complete